MPYRFNPKNTKEVQVHRNGRWVHRAFCKSVARAKRMMNLLRGVEAGGWKPTGAKAQDLKAKQQREPNGVR